MRSLSLLLIAGIWLAGCDAGVQCVVDTDCVLGNYCSAAGACLPLGTGGDGGRADVGATDGGPRDAMTSDVRTDAPPVDAPMTTDAPSSCPDVDGTYTITTVGTECGSSVTATTIVVTGPAPSECAYEIALDATGVGTVAQDGGRENEFSGLLNVVAPGTACTATFVPGTSLSLVCGACTITTTFSS